MKTTSPTPAPTAPLVSGEAPTLLSSERLAEIAEDVAAVKEAETCGFLSKYTYEFAVAAAQHSADLFSHAAALTAALAAAEARAATAEGKLEGMKQELAEQERDKLESTLR